MLNIVSDSNTYCEVNDALFVTTYGFDDVIECKWWYKWDHYMIRHCLLL